MSEDLGFRFLHPYRYSVLDNALKRSKGSQKQIVKRISDRIMSAMAEENIEGDGMTVLQGIDAKRLCQEGVCTQFVGGEFMFRFIRYHDDNGFGALRFYLCQ